jgi:hypothetical protein
MAREDKTTTQITSHLTGLVSNHEKDSVPQVKVTVNGNSAMLDLTPAETEALLTLVKEKDGTALQKLMAPVDIVPVKTASGRKSGKRATTDNRNSQIREWMRTPAGLAATGFESADKVPARGRMREEWTAAYDAAQMGAKAPAANPPANPVTT